jgi:hypothetical protein
MAVPGEHLITVKNPTGGKRRGDVNVSTNLIRKGKQNLGTLPQGTVQRRLDNAFTSSSVDCVRIPRFQAEGVSTLTQYPGQVTGATGPSR